ncbi:MAG: valine--tRNA ligase [Erysipelotrichaceae bacterium]|nr:valine--tRNA ligase [Erysipelotrichaceae bacterium]
MLDKRYNPHEIEKGKYDTWKEKGYFTAGDKTKQKFSMVIPPPNVTGKLHLGHSWNTTIQDIIARYKRAKGYDVLWLPGMDHAGIATQAKVEERLRKEGISRYDLGREKFLEKAWSWKNEYASLIHEQWKMMGVSLDYTRERFTLDEGLNKAVKKVFVSLYNKGLIYRGERIINWDPVFKTALSNIEVIHQDDPGKFYYFKYYIEGTSRYLEVATTRPETMFGDVCVCVNPKDERYKDVVGKYVINPANGDRLPIIADRYVDMEFGTGAMKCTPAHDPNDFVIGQKHGLPHPICMNEDATMNELCGKYQGQDRFVCRENLVNDIKEAGNLIKIEDIVHPVGHSERSHCVVEPYLSKQWFVKMDSLAQASLDLQDSEEKIEFIPERFNKIFTSWMTNPEDWCISRQLWWGHRIPAYYHKVTGEIVVSEEPPVDSENYYQDEDVLDTWFSSALWTFSTLGWPEETEDLKRYFPLDVMVTAYDIIFFWVARMIFQGLEFTGKRPFDKVLIHGLIRDAQGRKMSKSLGNGIDPIDVINKYGVDALRYFLTTSTSPGLDTRYSDEKLEASANYLNKIWNISRFILLNIEGEEKEYSIKDELLDELDLFILSRLQKTIEAVTTNMEKYDFANASTHLYNFVYDDLASSYLEFCKIKLNSSSVELKDNTKAVLLKVLKSIILMIYPYTPFIAEEIYQQLPGHKESIMLDAYPEIEQKYISPKAEEKVFDLIKMIKDIRNFKAVNELAPNQEMVLRFIPSSEEFSLDLYAPYLAKFAFAKDIALCDNAQGNIIVYSSCQMIIQDNIDKDELIKKLDKEIARLQNEVARGEKMLSNPGFIAKAPQEKIELEKNKLESYKKELQQYLDKKNCL